MKLSFPFHAKHMLWIIVGTVVAVIVIGFAVVRYIQIAQELAKLKQNPSVTGQFSQEQQQALVDAVGSLIELPKDEVPTIATVTDVDRLKNQPFFTHALNGDKVLIYTNAKKAILYRESTHKLIDVAPVNLGPATDSAQPIIPTPTPEVPKISFVLRNGTTIVGLAKSYQVELLNRVPSAVVVANDNAQRRDYAKTVLVDVTEGRSVQAQEIARTLDIALVPFPQGESTPSSDFLIIIGTDKK